MLKFKGYVQQGRLKLDDPYDASDGTEVDLVVIDRRDDLDGDERVRLHAAILSSRHEAQRGQTILADEVLGTSAADEAIVSGRPCLPTR